VNHSEAPWTPVSELSHITRRSERRPRAAGKTPDEGGTIQGVVGAAPASLEERPAKQRQHAAEISAKEDDETTPHRRGP